MFDGIHLECDQKDENIMITDEIQTCEMEFICEYAFDNNDNCALIRSLNGTEIECGNQLFKHSWKHSANNQQNNSDHSWKTWSI